MRYSKALNMIEVVRILGVAVKCVDIERNTSGEGETLDDT